MPTKLKKPITIVIETVEDAVAVINRINTEEGLFSKSNRPSRYYGVSYRQFESLREALRLQQVDWRTWEPPKPIRAGEFELKEVFPNGDVQFNCTRVDRETIKAVMKLSDEAVKVEPEWPKWFYKEGCSKAYCNLLRMDSEWKGQWLDTRRGDREVWSNEFSDPNYIRLQLADGYKPITDAQAAEILSKP